MGVNVFTLVTFPAHHVLLTRTLSRDLVAVYRCRPVLVTVTWVTVVTSDWSIVVFLTRACSISLVTLGIKSQFVRTVAGATYGETVPPIFARLSGHILTVPPTLKLSTLTSVTGLRAGVKGRTVTNGCEVTGIIVSTDVLTLGSQRT